MSIRLICPFHVKYALTNINKLKGQVDLLITVSDARSLIATRLPEELTKGFIKAGAKVLEIVSKGDIADIKVKNSFNFKQQKSRNEILKLIREVLDIDKYHKQGFKPHFQVLVAGFPNTGKSTLINLLKGKKVAISENIPGKTRKISKFPIGDNIWVYDTPGILMFKSSKGEIAEKLFLINSAPNQIKNYSDILSKAYIYIYKHYLKELETLLDTSIPEDYSLFLEVLANRYKFKKAEDKWDIDKAEAKFLNILWSGQIKLNWDKDD